MGVAKEDRSRSRQPRDLSPAQAKVKTYLKRHHGLLSKVARETQVSVQFVNRIAYNLTESRSKGLRVEHALLQAGVPLIQKIR